MTNKAFLLLLCFCVTTCFMYSQDILGQWKTIDDKTGEEKSIVDIYEENGKIYGKIIYLFNPKKRDALCVECEGDDFNQPVVGLKIIKNMVKVGDSYKKGTITNPEDGEVYDCRLQLDKDTGKLQVRGYIAFFYRTQHWIRMKGEKP